MISTSVGMSVGGELSESSKIKPEDVAADVAELENANFDDSDDSDSCSEVDES